MEGERDTGFCNYPRVILTNKGQILSLYIVIDERRGVQGNSSMRSREFPRVQPEGTPKIECWYFPVLADLTRCTDIIQFLKVIKL